MSATHQASGRITVGANTIHYVDRGTGPALLLIHGLAGDNKAWAPQIEAWSKNYRVIAPDTRGAGLSTQTPDPLALEDLAKDFLSLMEQLKVERFHLVGRSMGGSIGQLMYLMAPKRVASMAMLASCAKFDPVGIRRLSCHREILISSKSWATWGRHAVTDFVSHQFFNRNPEAIARIEALVAGETRLQACYVEQNKAVLAHDALDRLKDIRCPVLVGSGGRDPLCGPLATSWMLERLPNAQHEFFADNGHFFLMEEPERFMKMMDGWLKKQTQNG